MGGKSIGELARRSEAAPADGTILCRVRLSLSYRSERAPAQRPKAPGATRRDLFATLEPRGEPRSLAAAPDVMLTCLACPAGGSQLQAGWGDGGGRAARYGKRTDFPGRCDDADILET